MWACVGIRALFPQCMSSINGSSDKTLPNVSVDAVYQQQPLPGNMNGTQVDACEYWINIGGMQPQFWKFQKTNGI